MQQAMPVWRRWLVQKVVAMGTPSAARKVLYCMEQIKLMATWEIWKGAVSGSRPRTNTAAISTATSTVSHWVGRRQRSEVRAASDKKAPRK